MKRIKESNQHLNTILAFAIIPLSGFALDIYIPSLPDMAATLKTSASAIQSTLSVFLIFYGAGQLISGSFLDAWGRYRPKLTGLLVFSITSLIIANITDILWIDILRAIQGTAVAIIIVSNRAYFLDSFKGEKLKHYTSLFSVIWSAAPIIAPFIGGYLQNRLGWQSNFYFLSGYGLLLFLFELIIGGETLSIFQPLRIKNILPAYSSMIKTKDFTAGLLMLGLAYGTLLVYNMSSPFIIEKVMHYPPTVTGNFALASGIAMLAGGILSKIFISKPFKKKILIMVTIQLITVSAMILVTIQTHNLFTLLGYVLFLHTLSGFIFNTILSYCLTRFSTNAAIASGLAGGGYIIFTSAFSYGVVSILTIQNQFMLGIGYLLLIIVMLLIFTNVKWQIAALQS